MFLYQKKSSYQEYINKPILCDTAFALGMIGDTKSFVEFHNSSCDNAHIDIETNHPRLSYAEALCVAQGILGNNIQQAFDNISKASRDELLSELKKHHISIRQAERITGIGRKIVSKAYTLK